MSNGSPYRHRPYRYRIYLRTWLITAAIGLFLGWMSGGFSEAIRVVGISTSVAVPLLVLWEWGERRRDREIAEMDRQLRDLRSHPD